MSDFGLTFPTTNTTNTVSSGYTATGTSESNPEDIKLWEQQEKEKAEAKKQQEISRIKSEVSAKATSAANSVTVPIAGDTVSKADFNEGLMFSGVSGDADAMAEVKSDSGFISSLKSMWESAKEKLSPKQEQTAGPITSTNEKLLDMENKQKVASLKNKVNDSYYKTQAKLSDINKDIAEKTKLVDTPIKSAAPSFGSQVNETKKAQTDSPSDINNITPEQLAEFAKAQGLEYTPATNSTDGMPAAVEAEALAVMNSLGIPEVGSKATDGKTINTEERAVVANNMGDLATKAQEIVAKLSDMNIPQAERDSLMKELDTITTKSTLLIGETPKALSPEDQQAMQSYLEAQVAAGKGLDTDDEEFKKLSPDAQKALMALSADVSSKATEKN